MLQYQCFFNRFISFSSIQIPIRYTIYCQELLCLIGNCYLYHWESTPGNLAKCSPNIATITRTCVFFRQKISKNASQVGLSIPSQEGSGKAGSRYGHVEGDLIFPSAFVHILPPPCRASFTRNVEAEQGSLFGRRSSFPSKLWERYDEPST